MEWKRKGTRKIVAEKITMLIAIFNKYFLTFKCKCFAVIILKVSLKGTAVSISQDLTEKHNFGDEIFLKRFSKKDFGKLS